MKNTSIKLLSLPLMAVLALPVFAQTYIGGSLQPYPADVGNVEISFQTINQLQPASTTGPSTYTGPVTINMVASNIAGNPVNIACAGTGVNFQISVCSGAASNITDCTWTNEDTATAVSLPTITGLAVGSSSTTSQTLSSYTTAAAWGTAFSTTAPVECTITDTVTSASVVKQYYVPVS